MSREENSRLSECLSSSVPAGSFSFVFWNGLCFKLSLAFFLESYRFVIQMAQSSIVTVNVGWSWIGQVRAVQA